MAAPIAPISIAAPAELITARPATTVSSAAIKKDSFKNELNSAAQQERTNNHQAEMSKKQQNSDVKADKSDQNSSKEHSNNVADNHKSSSSLNARDTNEVSAQQRKELKGTSDNLEKLAKENQIIAENSVEKDIQQTTETGKNLPLNGETLPQPAINSKEIVTPEQVIDPPFDKTALDLEISKLHSQVTQSQPETILAAQVVATLQDEGVASDNTKAAVVGETRTPQNTPVLQAETLQQVNVNNHLQTGAQDGVTTSVAPVSNTQESFNGIPKTVVNTNVESIASTKIAAGTENVIKDVTAKNDSVIAPVTRIAEQAKPVAKEVGAALNQVKPVSDVKVDVTGNVKELSSESKIDTAAQLSSKSENTQIDSKSTALEADVTSKLKTIASNVDDRVNTPLVSPVQDANVESKKTITANDTKVLDNINTDKTAFNSNPNNINEQPKTEVINTAQAATDKIASEVQNVIPVANNPTKTELEPKVSQLQAIAASIDSKAASNIEKGSVVNSASSQSSVVDFVSQVKGATNTNVNQLSSNAQGAVLNNVPVINEQTQSASLNQTLDKIRAGVDVTDSKGVQEGSDSKATSVKVSANVESLQQLSNFQSSLRSASPVQMQMPAGTPPGAKNWGRAVADKVYIAASQNLRVANIQLDPPELGALQIRLQVTGPDQQMSVAFSSPHASVRDVLEQQIPRLKEMLAEQGINLGESSVNDQGGENKQGTAESGSNRGGNYAEGSDIDNPANPLNTQGTLSLVDFYA